MARLDWASLPRQFEAGLSKAVLYSDEEGVAWNGLISVEEQATGEQDLDIFFDGQRRVIVKTEGDFEAKVLAYTYPDPLDEPRGKRYGMSYRTAGDLGDKIHIVYNAAFFPSAMQKVSINEKIDPSIFTWDLKAAKMDVPGAQPSSHLILDLTAALQSMVPEVEGWLYGTDTEDARLPAPEEVVEIFEAAATLRIRQLGDGLWSAEGPDDLVTPPNILGRFTINAPTLQYLEDGLFVVESF